MQFKRKFTGLAAATVLLLLAGTALAHVGQHPSGDNHLKGTGAWGKVKLVGKVTVSDAADDRVSDVAAKGNYAYLGAYAQDDCDIANRSLKDADNKLLPGEKVGQTGPDGGVFVVDISDPAAPRQVGFIRTQQDTYVGEGVQVISLNTASFKGDVLVVNNEGCGSNFKGGFSLWDVTKPTQPQKLSEHMGDFTILNAQAGIDAPNTPHDSNQVHSAFAWTTGTKAYTIITDDDELGGVDFDIMDITNPRKPLLIGEFDPRKHFPVSASTAKGAESFLHDMVVKKFGNRYLALLSYWDSGWLVFDVTNPAAPVYVAESDYNKIDELLQTRTGTALDNEGNGHQAEWTHDGRYFIGTDEDFSPFEAEFSITTGGNMGAYPAGEFGFATPIAQSRPDGILNGPVVFGGYGCAEDKASIPPASVLDGKLVTGEEKILVLSRGPVNDPAANFEACFFQNKLDAAAEKGYDGVIIANHHAGSGGGAEPDAAFCGGGTSSPINGVCIGHRALHLLFNTAPDYTLPYPAASSTANTEPKIGQFGDRVAFTTRFDGWGYVRLYSTTPGANGKYPEIGQYAINESHQKDKAFGFGALSVHEVATDPATNRAYLSYYAGGFRALEYGPTGMTEIGGYLDPAGNDFWGVEVWKHPATGKQYVLGSDLDSGLWIFEVTP
jgi:hypothetical protein